MDVFMLNVTDYISPECTCKVEDMVAKLEHVASVEFNPLTQILKVTAHQGMMTREALTKHLEDCGVLCSDDAPESMTRRDYCVPCWSQDNQGGAFSFWRTQLPRHDAPVRRFVDDEIVLDLFRRLKGHDEPDKRNFRYVLALLLMRKKVFKFKEVRRSENDDALILTERGSDCEHVVVDPNLSEEQIQQVTVEVGQILNVKV